MLLKKCVSFQNGIAFSSDCFNSNRIGMPIIKIKELKTNRVHFFNDSVFTSLCVDKNHYVHKNDLIVALTGDPNSKPNPDSWVGRVSIYRYDFPSLLNQRLCKIRADESIILQRYLFYMISNSNALQQISSLAKGSASQANISHHDIEKLDFKLHSLPEQQHIVNILGSIDDKIENNEKMCEKLEIFAAKQFAVISKTAYFPANLENIVQLTTGKKDANAQDENGLYPFFTCAKNDFRINTSPFDCEAILIAGNGDISVKYYKGKFDAYQRTYVITASNCFFYILHTYKSIINKIVLGARGSVIKFLTKSMLLDIEINLPNEKTITEFENSCKSIYEKSMILQVENQKLVELKQLYLKKFFG